jgi:hypothetical protein
MAQGYSDSRIRLDVFYWLPVETSGGLKRGILARLSQGGFGFGYGGVDVKKWADACQVQHVLNAMA